MERILERYERYSYAERQLLANDDPENHVCHLSNCFFNL
jgi:MADS-box transcription factor